MLDFEREEDLDQLFDRVGDWMYLEVPGQWTTLVEVRMDCIVRMYLQMYILEGTGESKCTDRVAIAAGRATR